MEHWAAQAVTVVLVIWDVSRKQGWWMWVNFAIQFLQENNPDWKQYNTVSIHFPLKNLLNEGELLEIRRLLANLYYPIISKDKELTINAKFTFPQTPEGKAKFEELKRHFATGDEVEIDGKFIEALDFPEWWTRLYGEFEPAGMYLKIAPNRSKTSRPAQFEFISEIGIEKIPYVELWIIKGGEEELTLTNDLQNIFIKLSIVLNKVTGQNKIGISTNFSKLNSISVLQILKIQKILFTGGSIRVTLLDIGEVMTVPVPPGSMPAPEQSIVDFVEKINFIENAMGIKINTSEDGFFTQKDVHAADELVSVIEKGNYRQSGMIFTLDLRRPGIASLLAGFTGDSPIYIQLTTDESYVEILSQRIELGPMLQKIRGYWKMPPEEVRTWFEQANDDDSLVVRLVDVELFEEFERWPKK